MIEVEKKFVLTSEQEAALLEGAEFVSKKTFTDSYYDNAQWSLSTSDIWLRERGNVFELKLPRHQTADKRIDQYEEIVGEEKIRQIFAVAPLKSFKEDLADLGHAPFCTCTTTRRKYKKEDFVIDLDQVQYENFTYRIGEIELMVEKEDEVPAALEKITAFAQAHELEIAPVRGKVIEYLKRKKPAHYQALAEAGVLAGKEY